MGLQQSKEELLYQQVNYGNVDGIGSQGMSLSLSVWVINLCPCERIG